MGLSVPRGKEAILVKIEHFALQRAINDILIKNLLLIIEVAASGIFYV